MRVSDVLYSLGWQTIRPVLAVSGLFSTKLAAAVAGRRSAACDIEAWAADHRGDGPLLWLHGASAGELAGAAPVIAAVRAARREMRLAVTYSSPSGEATARRLEPDYHGFVPLDLRGHTDAAVAALRPSALIYAKLDVWPNLTASARAAGVPIGLINATVRPDSGRLRRPSRALTRRAYAAVTACGAVTAEDAERLEVLGARRATIRVTGDASFDQAIGRLAAASGRMLSLPPRAPGVVRLIAGSTWPEDEAFLMEAIGDLTTIELVLVPHEPTQEAIERIRERVAVRLRKPLRRYTELASAPLEPGSPGHAPPPIVVDAVGLLAELYLEGDIAYVGGALAGTGLHSVVEPAAAGLPVLFGRRHDRWEALGLVAAGAAIEVDPTSLYPALVSLCDVPRRRGMGEAARGFVEKHAGAGTAGADLVLDLMRPAEEV